MLPFPTRAYPHLRNSAQPTNLTRLEIARLIGIAFFAVAFFLPAVNLPGDKPDSYGWQCAWFTITLLGAIQDNAFAELLAVLSALASPLALLFAALSFWKKPATLRLWLAPILLACLIAASVFLGPVHTP